MNIYNILLFTILILLTLLFFIPNILNFFKSPEHNISLYTNQRKRIQKFQNVQNPQTPQNPRELFEYYYQGIPEKYDNDGKKIQGIPPNPQKAIETLKLIIDSPQSKIEDVLLLANIYHRGMHNLEPNLEKAEKIYNDLLNNTGILYIREKAYTALDDISKTRYNQQANRPLEVPQRMPNLQDQTPLYLQNNIVPPIRNYIPDTTIPELELDNINAIIAALEEQNFTTNDNIGTKYYNDPQNTHDSQVVTTTTRSVNNIKDKVAVTDEHQVYNEVMEYVKSKPNSDKKNDAIKSLEKIAKSNKVVNGINMTGMESLNLVWNRIKDPLFDDNRNNVKDILFEELASIQEYDATVCPQGRVMRIIDTLNVVDPEVSIKPKYAINEEMMNKSAKIRRDMLDSHTDKHNLEIGNSVHQTEFDNKLKDTIVDTLTRDYVETGIMSQEQFNSEINKWIEYI